MLREFGILDDDPNIAHEVYLRACSTMATCRDLSLMGATWANGGTNPLTGEEVLDPLVVRQVLSVMTTCGMYDDTGEWVTTVGLPAKSSVAGAIIAVLPGRLGIAVYSPRLCPATQDGSGNRPASFNAVKYAMLAVRIAGCWLLVRTSSSSVPLKMRSLSRKPSASSTVSKTCCAAGDCPAASRPIPVFCDP
jgi:glutaminase